MKEKLIIRNFGPIKEFDFTIKLVNVLIGGQGTGKSSISKLLNIFKDVDFLTRDNDFRNEEFRKHLIHNYFQEDTKIQFKSNHYSVSYNKNKLTVKFEEPLKEFVKVYRKNLSEKLLSKQILQERSSLLIKIEELTGNASYIPAERILIPLLSNSSFSFSENKINVPNYISNFGTHFQIAREKLSDFKIDFLGISFKYQNGNNSVVIDNKEIPLRESASGFQTIVPLIVTLTEHTNYDYIKGFFLIEEPELNLFPYTQYSLTKYLLSRCKNVQDRVLMTTHSPYILTSLNNLMYAWQVGKMRKEKYREEVIKIIEEKYWVNPNDVSAYQLLSDGTATNIIADDGLIMAENIDAVSRQINEEYDLIQDIKIDSQNKTN